MKLIKKKINNSYRSPPISPNPPSFLSLPWRSFIRAQPQRAEHTFQIILFSSTVSNSPSSPYTVHINSTAFHTFARRANVIAGWLCVCDFCTYHFYGCIFCSYRPNLSQEILVTMTMLFRGGEASVSQCVIYHWKPFNTFHSVLLVAEIACARLAVPLDLR